jgi:hypothetical protein
MGLREISRMLVSALLPEAHKWANNIQKVFVALRWRLIENGCGKTMKQQ